jgi:AraC family transcriptional activator of pobA
MIWRVWMHNAGTKNHRYLVVKTTLTTVPKVRLYVESAVNDSWFVHVGQVSDRGSWRTAPHAHPDYGQIIFVRSGCGVMNLEGRNVRFQAPCALLLPTESIHGLDYERDIDRMVVTVEQSYLSGMNAKLREFSRLWSQPRVIGLGDPDQFNALTRALAREIDTRPVGYIVGIQALLVSLQLILVRSVFPEAGDKEVVTRNDNHVVARFRSLIEQHYCENWSQQDYASIMAISVLQLRAACASATGHSPTKMIYARRIAEAKRHLIFGAMSMEQIAGALGFSNGSYFTRFFRKEVGQAPSQFRLALTVQKLPD